MGTLTIQSLVGLNCRRVIRFQVISVVKMMPFIITTSLISRIAFTVLIRGLAILVELSGWTNLDEKARTSIWILAYQLPTSSLATTQYFAIPVNGRW